MNLVSPRMPAEWEPHEATWLAWPQNPADWPGKLTPVAWAYVEIVRLLAPHERVEIIVDSEARERRVRRMLADAGVDLDRVGFHRMPTDRSWVRDSGPTFVSTANGPAAICWQFNAWAKYSNWRRDAEVGGRIAEIAGARAVHPEAEGRRITLEGGAIDVDGAGLLLATEECLLSPVQERNPGWSREDYERLFAETLGVRQTIWIPHGIVGDDTHGHIDDTARFVEPGRAAACVELDSRDENRRLLSENLKALRAAGLEVIELPMPRPLFFRGVRVPASYANFYVANGRVLVPTFNDPHDRLALATLAAAFPDRETIGVHSVDLVWGFGTLHCSTQQQPAVPKRGV